METMKIVDGKVYNLEGQLLGDLDHVDGDTVYIKGEPPGHSEHERLKADLAKALKDAANPTFDRTSYQILNQGPRPKRNGPCPNHPKVKFKNCPCSRKDWNINLVKHDIR